MADRTNETAASKTEATLTLTLHVSGLPEGVTADHVSEYLAAFIENRDPHLSERNLDAMTDPRKILEAVLAVQLHDEDGGRPTVADALPDDLAQQAQAAASGGIEIQSLVTCRTCHKAYIPMRGAKLNDALPCGHTPSAWMIGEHIVRAEEQASKRRK